MPAPQVDENWKDHAACGGLDMVIFFPEEPITTQRVWDQARTFCNQCTVRQQCLDYAINHETLGFRRYGMFGGMTPKERERYAEAKKR